MLTGGVDVDPALYGDTERHPTVETDPARDGYELPLARLAVEHGLPLLAICRGAQVLNVAAGGTLVQDIPDLLPGTLGHSVVEPRNAIAHDVTIAQDSCLAALLASRTRSDRTVAVNSRHHQSVKAVAPGFVVTAVAADGVVEAIERPDAPFCIGVQWHPENFWATGEFQPLFEGLVAAAGRVRAGRRAG
jgi:putative glutamine amidotransferase